MTEPAFSPDPDVETNDDDTASMPATDPAPVLDCDPELPITACQDDIIAAIRHQQVVIVAGETGSGKTTQLPKMCLLAGRSAIGHTQPRRIAARSVAERIAEEMRVELGELVGYQVRFTRQTNKNTQIKVMTDGVLLNEIGLDPLLRRYDTIIIDEAHERSLNIDFLLGYLKQLLAKRSDLKVIVTSATIDTQRFSAHFDQAPIIEVSGRTYPVEIRYRPLFDADLAEEASVVEKDQTTGICDAINELSAEGNGDILVFLSGEREIRDTMEAIHALDLRFTEVVPLYARLSAQEQHQVFSRHSGRRIVLATNVAETSLTVPGIRYVIDAGTARISRYSAKTKVQRLPIEPISQASANQRSGRCGRVAPGIAIRLYSQSDYESRPEFTEPEILRTNLASVILRMAEAKLGAIEDFPFVEAPDRTHINDGIRLLDELGALEQGKRISGVVGAPRLTRIGKLLARIPVDPRLGRMIVEAHEQGCLREVLIIVAGLSVQDPRERPQEAQEAADACHQRFWTDAVFDNAPAPVRRDTRGRIKPSEPTVAPVPSDFMVLLRLWTYVARNRQQLSGNAFRRLCREEYINYGRVRDWQDLYVQLRDACIDLKLTAQERKHGKHRSHRPTESTTRAERVADDGSSECGDVVAIHTAIVAGLLSHIGLADLRESGNQSTTRKRVRLGPQEYLGARGSRFAINRGSSVAKTPPSLVMAFELVETNRLWARTVAAIEPEWIEKVAGHLLKRTYSEPHWSSKRGAAMAFERVSLLGVPIIAQRQVQYGRINPSQARAIFIQSALIEGDWQTRHHFYARNRDVLAQAEEMEQRSRRTSVVIDDSNLFNFYDQRIPGDVVSQTHFDTWWRAKRREDDLFLDLCLEDIVATEDFDHEAFPDNWQLDAKQGNLSFEIDYAFDPGSGHDGVSISIPLNVLNQISPEPFTWQVPGLRQELATELIRALPKQIRTSFVPAPDFARRALNWIAEQKIKAGVFADVLGQALTALTGIAIDPQHWNQAALPGYLTPTFVIYDGAKKIAQGKDLSILQQEQSKQLIATLTQAAQAQRKTGATHWVFDRLAEKTEFLRGSATIVGYPALVDEGSSVGQVVADTLLRAQNSHALGLRRLVTLNIPDPTKWVVAHLSMQQKMSLSTSPYPSVPALLADARLASVGYLISRQPDGAQVRDSISFDHLCDVVREDHAKHFQEVVQVCADALARFTELSPTLSRLGRSDAAGDITEQLNNLIFPGFIAATPELWLRQLPRYLRAIGVRLETLRTNPAKDDAALDVIMDLEDEYARLCHAQPEGPLPAAVAEVGWLLEELRVSLFAQTLGTRIPVSAKRVRKAMADFSLNQQS